MTTPSMPLGFNAIISDYGFSGPGGVVQSEMAGGSPRTALAWDRGSQRFGVTIICEPARFSVLALWHAHVIRKGAISFNMHLDSGLGFASHLCTMVAGSWQVNRQDLFYAVAFAVDAEPQTYLLTEAEALAVISVHDMAHSQGTSSDALLDRLADFAIVDLTTSAP